MANLSLSRPDLRNLNYHQLSFLSLITTIYNTFCVIRRKLWSNEPVGKQHIPNGASNRNTEERRDARSITFLIGSTMEARERVQIT